MMFDLKNRKALITGAGQGMGLGIAKALKDAGANVFINDLYPERAQVGHDGITVNALSLGTMNNFDDHERAAQSTLVGRARTLKMSAPPRYISAQMKPAG